MKLKKLIEAYIKEAKLMQIATSHKNQPWACSVYFASDKALNLYWISTPDRRHSEEIRNNKKIAGAIVLPHTPGEKPHGLQFQGIARELTKKLDIKKAMTIYAKRYNMSPKRLEEIINKTDGHLPYQITPTHIVLFDEINFPDDARQVYKL